MKALWTPTDTNAKASNLWRFITWLNKKYTLQLADYPGLYAWSIAYPEKFWAAVWKFCDIHASQLWSHVLIDGDKMPGATWFSGARLNFAENLLRRRDNATAIVFYDESSAPTHAHKRLSFEALYKKTAQLAATMRAMGVQPGDRIAGCLTNCPEAIIAMLASASLGAIWSSCSPDFGTQGILDRFTQIEPTLLFAVDGYTYHGKTYVILDKLRDIQKQIPSIQQTIVVQNLTSTSHTPLSNTVLFDDCLNGAASELVFAQCPFDHPLYIMYSSGTTGKPKCIVHGAGGTLIQHLKELALHTDLTRGDTLFYFTTCGWMMWNWMVSALALGVKLVLYDGFPFQPTARLFDLIDAENITVFGVSAKYLSAAESRNLKPRKTHQLKSLRSILSTGSPLLPRSFDYVYSDIKADVCLSSISGGTDLIGCFALGNPLLAVYRGELQCIGLGMRVEIKNDVGETVLEKAGELTCTMPFPSMPIYFWHDKNNAQYRRAYFEKYAPQPIWAHGDYARLNTRGGLTIYGRSDATLNPGGVRLGTADIYQAVEALNEIDESLAIGQQWQDDERIILFVTLQPGYNLDDTLREKIKRQIRIQTSPRHIPAKIIEAPELPRTLSGKIVELAVREVVHNRQVKNKAALANPGALDFFKDLDLLE